MEAVEFNGLLPEFEALGVQVLGASVDGVKANRSFAERYTLAFPLLCDTERTLILAFGVDKPDKPSARRTTFLLESDGTVRRVFENVSAAGHAAEVLTAAREVWGAPREAGHAA